MRHFILSEYSFNITSKYSDKDERQKLYHDLISSNGRKLKCQSIILKSTISNFENCLKIAKKVADFVEDVAIIIKFIPFVFIEVLEDKSLKTSVRQRAQIKLTQNSTKEDRQQAWSNYNQLKSQMKDLIEGILGTKEKDLLFDETSTQKNHKQAKKRVKKQNSQINYRAKQQDQLSDQQDEILKKPSKKERQEGNRIFNKSRGGSKAGQTIGSREQIEHNYKKQHLKH